MKFEQFFLVVSAFALGVVWTGGVSVPFALLLGVIATLTFVGGSVVYAAIKE